jgi:xanthine dehydrogenase YagS FAD-binding subunit
VSVSTIVQTRGEICQEARVVLGGVAPIPWRVSKSEGFLRGKRIDSTVAQKASDIALEGATPMKDNLYKVGLAKSLIERSLLAAA